MTVPDRVWNAFWADVVPDNNERALERVVAELSREPSSFNWTPALAAVFPARLTMSQLLAIWNAMQEAAVYGAPGEGEEADSDGWIANDNLAKPEWLAGDTKIDVKFRYGGQVLANVNIGNEHRWKEHGPSTITHWRYHK